ncbi:MAG: hypothetical protein KJ578_15745 [Bacteroidetes bacterium]|nr:hypothetical protein [Bacteroidota bacterium]
MAEGRMLKRVITTSRKLAELKTDSARLLYTWLIPFLDVEGRFYGNPDIIKGFIIPRIKDFTTEKVTECLFDMQKVGLILWYQVDGDKYLEFTCFEKHQNINKDREAKSSFPISTQENSGELLQLQENSGELLQLQENSGELSVKLSKDKLSKDKLSKDKLSKDKLSKDKLSKDKYSDFVLLTEKELSQLIDKLGESQTQEWIEKLNNYIGSTERQYKSHYYTILNWSKKDSKKDIEEELTDSDRNQIQSEKVFREWTEQLRKEKEAEALNGTD